MRWIAIAAVLAGCPAPAPPPPEEPAPPPPPVVVIDAEPEHLPGVLAVRAASSALELVLVDAAGEARVLQELQRTKALPRVADLAVDATSRRYAVLVEADAIGGADTQTPRDVMSILLGTLDGETIAIGPGDKRCVMHKCFESAVAIAPGGDAIVTTLVRAGASDLARYELGPTPKPIKLTAKGVEKPTLSPDLARLAYLRKHAIHVVDVGSTAKSTPVVTGAKDVAALALGDGQLAYRTGAGDVVVVDVETRAARTVARVAADPRPALRVVAGALFTTDGGQVIALPLAGGEARVVATGALLDVSADGAWVLVDDDALAIVRAADGEIVARLDVPAAFGEVRARLAP